MNYPTFIVGRYGIHAKILDYGEERFQDLLLKYGDQVEELLLYVAKK